MFDHVAIAVSDVDASRRFYTHALGEPTADDEWLEWGDFCIGPVDDQHPWRSRRLHVGFGVESERARAEAVDAWWQRMIDAGYRSDGEPGPRPEYTETYHGGFVLDPDGSLRTLITVLTGASLSG